MERLGGARRPRSERQASGPEASDPVASGRSLEGPGFAERILVTLSGIRQPIVAILLLISFFTVISGKPLDGLLLAVVATALAWDAGIRARDLALTSAGGELRSAASGYAAEATGLPWVPDAEYPLAHESPPRSAWRPRTGRPRTRHMAFGIAAAITYALIVGSFTRYSWPATAGVAGLGTGVVIVAWGGPTRKRQIPGKFSRSGVLAWGLLLVAGSLWELGALLGQPTFEQSSYAHPTISTLTDPLLSSSPGRMVALLGWIGLGAFLVER